MGWTMAAGMAMQAMGTMQAADAQKQAGQSQQAASNYTAQVAEQQAGQARASAQRQAEQERLNATRASSRVRAVAAASGGGADDPTVMKIQSDIAGQGEFNALSALYTGEERGRGLESDASLRRFEGDAAAVSGDMKSTGTMMSGFGTILGSASGNSLYSKYGMGNQYDSSGGRVMWNSPRQYGQSGLLN